MCLKLENQEIPVILSYNTDHGDSNLTDGRGNKTEFKIMVPERFQQRAVHLLLNITSELDSMRAR